MIVPILLLIALLLPAAVAGGPRDEGQQAVLHFEGRPLRLPIQCSADELAGFGMVCSVASPCPVYLELTSVEPAGGKIFVAGNLHSTTVTMYSVLLSSADGGLTWKEPFRRLPHAGLDRVFFIDAKHGWVSGHILEAQPRDPFFLLTTDGGKFWRLRSILRQHGAGEIQKFWFDSVRTGGVLIDHLRPNAAGARYERYQTMTGGESWMIREVNSLPIRVRTTSRTGQNPAWRIRADRATHAWSVERRQPNGWTVLARFAIETGQCAPPEEKLAPVPPEASPRPALQPSAPGGVFRVPGPGATPSKPRPERPPPPEKPPS